MFGTVRRFVRSARDPWCTEEVVAGLTITDVLVHQLQQRAATRHEDLGLELLYRHLELLQIESEDLLYWRAHWSLRPTARRVARAGIDTRLSRWHRTRTAGVKHVDVDSLQADTVRGLRIDDVTAGVDTVTATLDLADARRRSPLQRLLDFFAPTPVAAPQVLVVGTGRGKSYFMPGGAVYGSGS